MAQGDASSTLRSFTESIKQLCDAIYTQNKEIASIKSTMSDLRPVNALFNEQLKQLRERLPPKIQCNWNDLCENKKQNLTEMGNFYCKLHLLANFASETDKVLKEVESLILHQNYSPEFVFATKESGVARLVRTMCKAFHSRVSHETGVAS